MSNIPSDVILQDQSGARIKVRLGKVVGAGGAGTVFHTPELPDVVVKVYKPNTPLKDMNQYARKLPAMVEVAPRLEDLGEDGHPYDRFRGGERYVQIAWPKAVALDGRGQFVGFSMPSVDVSGTTSFELAMDDKDAERIGLHLGKKATLGFQLSGLVKALHDAGHYFIDLKPVNLNFYTEKLYMAVLDCDGFYIRSPGGNFEAPQFTEEYLAPEFQRSRNFNAGPEAQDRFALAVILFRLLNGGIHPYTGRPQNRTVPNELQEKIAANIYSYGLTPNPCQAPQLLSTHDCIPNNLRQMFDRAFGTRPGNRPSAEEWHSALLDYAKPQSGTIVKCAAHHYHFNGMTCGTCKKLEILDDMSHPGRKRQLRTTKAKQPPKLASNRFCAQCGYFSDPDANFCIQCGAKIEP